MQVMMRISVAVVAAITILTATPIVTPAGAAATVNCSPGIGAYPVTGNWDGRGGDGPGIAYASGTTLEWHLRNGPNPGPPEYRVYFR